MIGAVIGDLAAWTWENDRKRFFDRLVSPEAKLSGYGVLPIVMWPIINDSCITDSNGLYRECWVALAQAASSNIEIPNSWTHSEINGYDNGIFPGLKMALTMSAIVDSGLQPISKQKEFNWSDFFQCEEQERSAMQLMTILRRLNEGRTKDEAICDIPELVTNYYPRCKEHLWRELLEYTTFAWRSFYYSWDFTSALHNAAHCDGNRHLAMMLTGSLAEAMYGCNYSMTKKKFGGRYGVIEFPNDINPQYLEILDKRQRERFENLFFFKKNDALTNVERHIWTPVENPYFDRIIDYEFRLKMMKAYFTSWDDRYGVYFDNGWYYVYRSHCLLLRYKLTMRLDMTYRISELKISNDAHARVEDLGEVLYSLSRR